MSHLIYPNHHPKYHVLDGAETEKVVSGRCKSEAP